MYEQLFKQLFREAAFPVESFGTDHLAITPGMTQELRELSYLEQWRTILQRGWFHIRTTDHSLFIFKEGLCPSYSFLHCPLEIIPFVEYLSTVLGVENTPENRRSYREEYEFLFETSSERNHVTPMRFDYDENGYRTGVHPVAHVHVGLDNQIRLFSNKMTPTGFVLFVMRHMYPLSWERLIGRANARQYLRAIREPSTNLASQFVRPADLLELHLA